VNKIIDWEQVLVFLLVLLHKYNWMRIFTLLIGGAALFIAGCAAYFSVRGIALTFGAVSAFTIPIIIMASSLEFGKLIAASFLYRHWKTCNKTLRTYLSLAVVLLVCITSAGIYGYLSQAFEQTLSQVEGYEKEIVSLQRQQTEYDRLIAAYRTSGQKGSAMREEKHADERRRLELDITKLYAEIQAAEATKTSMAKEANQMIAGDGERRKAEQKRLETVIETRRKDIVALENQKKEYKGEVDARIQQELAKEAKVNERLTQLAAEELAKEAKVNERLAQLDDAVKAYRDKGRTFLEDWIKKANELLKDQAGEREALRASLVGINEAAQKERESLRSALAGIAAETQKARDDLDKRYKAIDERIADVQKQISEASLKITALTTGGAEQTDNVGKAMETLQKGRAAQNEDIQRLRAEIAAATRKITELSERESVYGPDSSAELEAKKGELLAKKEDAEREILALQGKIRATDIGSFKFVARAFDDEVALAEATENPILIKEATDNAVNRVVKWFIMILVVVFDPLAVTLVIAYNASLLRKPEDEAEVQADSGTSEEDDSPSGFFRMANLPIILVVGLLAAWGLYEVFDSNASAFSGSGEDKASLLEDLSARRFDDRAFAYVPDQAFAACSFSGMRMFEEVGLPKILSKNINKPIPFLEDIAWDPSSCGVNPDGRPLYFLQFPSMELSAERHLDVVFCLVLPVSDSSKLKEFILQELDVKAAKPKWKVTEDSSAGFFLVRHETRHIAMGMDDNCFLLMSSWWSDDPNPGFLEDELRQVLVFGQESKTIHPEVASKLSGVDSDISCLFDAGNFFENLGETAEEKELLHEFRDYLSFDLVLKAKASPGNISLKGEYSYDQAVLDSDYGLEVAGKLEKIRKGDESILSKGFGEWVLMFLQKFDYKSTLSMLNKLKTAKAFGFEALDIVSIDPKTSVRGNSTGFVEINVPTSEKGGDALCLLVDLLVAVFDPWPGENK
jgi:predicted  nucleic acid-binding Zn-ribbon protein